MYVYISDDVKNTANGQGFLRVIERIKEQIETGQPLLFALIFTPHYPYWKKRIRYSWRLIAELIFIDGEQILYLAHLLYRGSTEYAGFLDNPKTWGDNYIQPPYDYLQQWLRKRKEMPTEQQPVVLPLVPYYLSSWLQRRALVF